MIKKCGIVGVKQTDMYGLALYGVWLGRAGDYTVKSLYLDP
jgi:hypothetical protein